jgi:chorismate mutase
MKPDPITEELRTLRQEMDDVDTILVDAIVTRYRKAEEILAFKKKHNLPLHAPEREWRIIQRAVKLASNMGFREDSYIRSLWFTFLGHPFTKYYQHHFWTD